MIIPSRNFLPSTRTIKPRFGSGTETGYPPGKGPYKYVEPSSDKSSTVKPQITLIQKVVQALTPAPQQSTSDDSLRQYNSGKEANGGWVDVTRVDDKK